MLKIKNKGIKIIPVLLSFLVFTSCEKESPTPTESLQDLGILGKWQINMRIIDDISGPAVECCDYLEFSTNANQEDFMGDFRAYGYEYSSQGIFKIDSETNIIHFEQNNSERLLLFFISDNLLTLSYTNNNQNIQEIWKKEE